MSGSKSFDTAHDFPPMAEPSGKPILTFDRENPVRFTDLVDTINEYTGYGGYFLMIKLTEDGITVSPVEVETDKFYQHDQAVASLSWNVNHELGKYPSVQIVNTSGKEIIGDIEFIDENNITVSFDIAVAGKVYCN